MAGKNQHISANGGLDILISHLHNLGYWKSLDDLLGKRHHRAQYSNSDVILTWTMNMLAGCNRLEQTHKHRGQFLSHPKLKKGMSPDTISRVVKRFAVPNSYYTMADKASKYKNHRIFSDVPFKDELHEVNLNMPLNTILLQTAIKFGLINPKQSYEIDIDATIVSSKVSDSRPHYKKDGTGYIPMVVMLGGIPIFMEARNGNSGAALRKVDVLKAAINLFTEHNIKIKFVRIDAAGASVEMLKYLQNKKIKYLIRASGRARFDFLGTISEKPGSTPHDLKSKDSLVNFHGLEFRLIEYQRKYDDGEIKEWGILTNNYDLSSKEVIGLYNQRGAMEQRFADLKEMGWHYMVHRELKYNTVHMLITMLAYIIFIYSKQWLSKNIPTIKVTFKPKVFRKMAIEVITTWYKEKIRFLTRHLEFAPLKGFT